MTTFTYASTNDQWARPARSSVSLSKPEPCQFSLVRSVTVFVAYRGRCLYDISRDADSGQTDSRRRQPQPRCPTIRVAYSLQRRESTDGQTDTMVTAHRKQNGETSYLQ